MSTVITRLRRRRGDPPPDTSRDTVVVLNTGTVGSDELLAAARATGGTIAVVIPLKIHGYAFGMPNPGLMPTARERAAADQAISTTVAELRNAGVDVDGQIVVTRHAHRSIVRIVRRRNATHVLLEIDTTSRLRRFVEGDLHRQLSRRLRGSVTVTTATSAGGLPAPPR